MSSQYFSTHPEHASYDVVIVGGGMMGSATAFFLSANPDFDGRVLVIEKDPSYEFCSTTRSNSCIRQQFSNALNVRISQFGAEFIKNFRDYMGGDERVPSLEIQNFGYLYLADNPTYAAALQASQQVQLACGGQTRILSAEQIKAEYPFYQLDDILLGSLNTVDEGYWDGGTVFEWFKRKSREQGVEFVANEVVGLQADHAKHKVQTVQLKTTETLACGQFVNAAGPAAASVCRMLGIELPVEPRKRYTWVFTAEKPLDRPLPLTIDPSGVHVRQDGPETYMAGGHADHDPAVAADDYGFDHELWESHVWPLVATRIPQFESIRLVNEWVGHYAWNVLDQNAIVGPHDQYENFFFLNGFSGHGLQQSPAMGRAMSEYLVYGEYRHLDMSPLGYSRIVRGEAFGEAAII